MATLTPEQFQLSDGSVAVIGSLKGAPPNTSFTMRFSPPEPANPTNQPIVTDATGTAAQMVIFRGHGTVEVAVILAEGSIVAP